MAEMQPSGGDERLLRRPEGQFAKLIMEKCFTDDQRRPAIISFIHGNYSVLGGGLNSYLRRWKIQFGKAYSGFYALLRLIHHSTTRAAMAMARYRGK